MPNQHKPKRSSILCYVVVRSSTTDLITAPEQEIREPITFYFNLGLNDAQIVEQCRDHFDTNTYGLRYGMLRRLVWIGSLTQKLCTSVSSVKRFRNQWGLHRTRKQQHNFDTIAPVIAAIRARFPFRGAENIRKMLRLNHGMHVSRHAISLGDGSY